jgi:hypothetical protein
MESSVIRKRELKYCPYNFNNDSSSNSKLFRVAFKASKVYT